MPRDGPSRGIPLALPSPVSRTVWHGNANAHGTAQERRDTDGYLLSDMLPPLCSSLSRSHAASAPKSDYESVSEAAGLEPARECHFTDWDDKLIPLKGAVTYEFPRSAYVEYAYFDADKQPIADPTNPVRPKHPWHDFDRALTLPLNDFKEPPRPHTYRGHVYDHRMFSRVFDSQRTYYVYEPYLPPVATLYVHDGEGYYHKLCFHKVVEALLERGEIHPVRLVMIEPQDREKEYWFNERYEMFLLQEMLPEVDRRYGITQERALWGASLGGMVSSWLAWRNPHVFTKVGSQSGCFTADPEGGDEYHDRQWLTEQFAKTSHQPVRFY